MSHLALKFLRLARGWTQVEVATAAGVPTSRVTHYETGEGDCFPFGLIEQMAIPMGYESDQVTLTALYLRALAPSALDKDFQCARILALRLGIIAARQLYSFLLDLARSRHLIQARREGGRQWQTLRGLKAAEQLARIASTPVIHPWALVERLCDESVAAAARDAAESLHLATLALRVAEVAPGKPGWLLGFAWAFVGNAHRIRFHREIAERDFATARRLWKEDPPAPDCPLGQWRILNLEASYRRDCRQFDAALDLLERALAMAPESAKARILLSKGTIFDQRGDLRAALAVLNEAAPWVEESADERLRWTLGFNRASLLVQLGEFTEAEVLIPMLNSLAARRQERVRQTRLVWLGGRIAVGRGQRSVGRAALEQARREFAARGFAADAAVLSLEMAALDLEEGRVGEAAALAAEVMAIFSSLRVERETLMGLRVFCEADEAHTATAQMARHLVENWGRLGGGGHG